MMVDPFAFTRGRRDAPILFVGESWGDEEARQQIPFVGSSGQELDRMLLESGVDASSILFTNLFNAQPKGNDAWTFFTTSNKITLLRGLNPTPYVVKELEKLYHLIRLVKPSLIVACGNYALWALSECTYSSSLSTDEGPVRVPSGITSWRGSMLETDVIPGAPGARLLPIIHPAAIQRQWSLRQVTIHDLRNRIPMALRSMWRPIHGPNILQSNFGDTISVLHGWTARLNDGPFPLAHDIETSRGNITCMSFAHGPYDESGLAVVIPFIRPNIERAAGAGSKAPYVNFWSEREEIELIRTATSILRHPNLRLIGQNYAYDTQYLDAILGCAPNVDFDTMLAHHLLFPGTPKGLDYLSSLYCRFHWYWKEDLKEWDTHINFERNLLYNAEDALRTFECATALRQLIKDAGQEEQWEWEKRKAALALEMMNRGVLIDRERRAKLAFELMSALESRHTWLSSIIPQDTLRPHLRASKSNWWTSVAQQKLLFYELLGLKGQINRKTGRPTINFEALQELKRRNPEFTRLFDCLIECRSIQVYNSTFIQAELDRDNRIRCSFNTTGTSTFRWSSSENAFGRGTNLQNIPIGEESDA